MEPPEDIPMGTCCLHCCGERKQAETTPVPGSTMPAVERAITLAPMMMPTGQAVAVPTCWGHIAVARVSPLLQKRAERAERAAG